MSEAPLLARHFALDPSITFLNHGSFGACPSAILEVQRALRDRMEREPVQFFVRDLGPLLEEARAALGAFVGAAPGDLAFVTNATYGVNSVLRSLDFAPGDELLVTDHEYRASRNALDFNARRCGARVVVVAIPFPGTTPEGVVEAVLSRVTHRTRFALLDHITSQTGLVFPIEKLVSELSSRGVDVLVDGAHGPGMVPLDLTALGAAYYTGNCHKWLCAPKGAAFLHVRSDKQDSIRPLAISHGASLPLDGNARFRAELDWTGTDDPTAFLAVAAAITYLEGLVPGGFPALMEKNRALALEGRRTLCEALGVPLPCPDAMVGSLASVPLPDGDGAPPKSPLYLDPLQDTLFEGDRIEVPVIPWPAPPKRLIRISAQVYNQASDYEKLAMALRKRL